MENASVENANEATRGAPSPWNVLARTASDAPVSSKRDHRSECPKLEGGDMVWESVALDDCYHLVARANASIMVTHEDDSRMARGPITTSACSYTQRSQWSSCQERDGWNGERQAVFFQMSWRHVSLAGTMIFRQIPSLVRDWPMEAAHSTTTTSRAVLDFKFSILMLCPPSSVPDSDYTTQQTRAGSLCRIRSDLR